MWHGKKKSPFSICLIQYCQTFLPWVINMFISQLQSKKLDDKDFTLIIFMSSIPDWGHKAQSVVLTEETNTLASLLAQQVKEPSAMQEMQEMWVLSLGAWQPTSVLLPGKSHGQRRLVGYSPWGRRVGYNWSNWARHGSCPSLSFTSDLGLQTSLLFSFECAHGKYENELTHTR